MASAAFNEAVVRVVRRIPKGSVLSYGEVALLAGRPGAARAVVRVLNVNPKLPWWRVVRANRTLAPQIANEQARALACEGVCVVHGRVQAKAKLPRAHS